VASDTLALNQEIALRAYADVTYTRTEVNDTFVTSVNHVTALNTSNALHNNRFIANETAITAVETDVATKQDSLQDLGPVLGGDYVQLNDGTQLRRVHGSGEVVVTAANADLGGGITATFEHVEVSLDPAFTARVTAAEVAHSALQTTTSSRFDTVEADVATRQTLLTDFGPSTSGYVSLIDGNQIRRIHGGAGVEVTTAQAVTGQYQGVDQLSVYENIEVQLTAEMTGLPSRTTSLETDVVTRTTLHNNLQGEVTNGQAVQNTKIDVLEVLAATSTQNDASQLAMIQSLAVRLDAQERRYAVKIGPLTTGSSNAAAVFYGGNYNLTHTIAFPSGLFTTAPIVCCGQGAGSNTQGHSSIQRCWVISCSVSSCQIVISDASASLNVFIDLQAVQG